jgi:hypothetical protein
MDQEQTQNHFKGYALVEIFGHQKEAGFVETVYFGTACMFRVDVPGLDEREWALERPEYGQHTGYRELPVGTKVKRAAVAPRSRLLGVGAIYGMTPCTEEVVRKAIEQGIARPLIVLELPKAKELTAGANEEELDETSSDACPDCNAPAEEPCRPGCPNA